MFLELSIISLFILAITSLVALAYSKANKVAIFILTPIIIFASIVSGYSVTALQGTPIDEIPVGNVTVLSGSVEKPFMFFVVRHSDTGFVKLYKIPYDKNNAQQMMNLLNRAERKEVKEGEFKLKKFYENEEEIETIVFDEEMYTPQSKNESETQSDNRGK